MTSLVGWALVHFLWQGALVGAALAGLLSLSGSRSPRVRYAFSVAALLAMVALPAVTMSRLAAAPPAPAAPELSTPSPTPTDASIRAEQLVSGGDRAALPKPEQEHPGTAIAPAGSTPIAKLRVALQGWVDRSVPWLVALWLVGVLALSIRLIGGWTWARRLTRVGTQPASEACRAMLERLVVRLRVSGPIRLLESTVVQVPAVVGALRPVVLLPMSALSGLTPAQVEVLLAHELAHIRRHDYLVNLLQSVVETLLFYHPVVWWVSRRIREEREHCCDDLAVAACGDRSLYAGALLALEQLRRPHLGLAAAATGGSLVRRIRRLLTPVPAHDQEGPRWVAGLLIVGLVLAIGGGTTLSRATTVTDKDPLADDRAAEIQESALTSSVGLTQDKQQARGPARPDTVIRYQGSARLGDRMSWALETAGRERFRRFWIGYVLPGESGRPGWFFFDRHVPLEFGGGSMISGHIHMTELGQFRVPGVHLDSLVGDHSPRDIAILLGFRVDNGRRVLDRVRLSNFVFPVHFDGRPLVWLSEASDPESIALIRDLYDRDLTEEVREDLVSMVGVHGESEAAVPGLTQWLRGDESEQVRAQAAEALAWQPDPVALAALARAARGDRSSHVRSEAAEAVGDMDFAPAVDTLIDLARTLEDEDARREAVEALGVRREPKALEALVDIVRDDPSSDIQREAVETLGEVKDEGAVRHLREIATSHPRVDVRREAVETLGETMPAQEAVRVLERIAREDPDPEVEREAVETLGEVHDPRVVEVLESLAREHRNPEVAREAVETLGEIVGPERVLPLLLELARSHPSVEVRREAVETMGEIHAPEAARYLAELAEGAQHPEVQREAVETLGELPGESGVALEHLARIARTHPRPEVRHEAIETFAEHASAEKAVEFLTGILRSGSDPELQHKTLEMLTELDDGAGIPAVIEVARGHPDPKLRRKAIEALGDSDDPRARRLFEQLLGKP